MKKLLSFIRFWTKRILDLFNNKRAHWVWWVERRKMVMQSWSTDFLPFLAMVIVECSEMLMITLGKAAMNDGLNNLVYVVYYNALGTLFLLPCLIFRRRRFVKNYHYFLRLIQTQTLMSLSLFFFFRSNMVPITLPILWRFFLLGLLGYCTNFFSVLL